MAWNKICKDNKDGEIGEKKMEDMNHALLTKWGWKVVARPHDQISKTLKDKYCSIKGT